jgi:hypothetical protein
VVYRNWLWVEPGDEFSKQRIKEKHYNYDSINREALYRNIIQNLEMKESNRNNRWKTTITNMKNSLMMSSKFNMKREEQWTERWIGRLSWSEKQTHKL